MELVPGEREAARTAIRSLDERDGWEVVLVRESALAGKPYVPLRLRGRVHVRTHPSTDERATLLNAASEFVPAPEGSDRLALEATTSAGGGAPSDGFAEVAAQLDRLYGRLAGRRRAIHVDSDPLSDREWIAVDLHTHTSWSHDCSVPAADLLEVAEEIGLGAIAVTDHNVFGGAQEAAELARGRALTVIPGEEMKTKGQGEVIGLFLREEIPRGLSFEDAIAAVRAQGGLVFLPHPFDRRHAIPDPVTLHRHLAEIDVSRSTTRGCSRRRTATRRCASRGSTTSCRRRLGRARAAGLGTGRCDARGPDARRVPDQPAHRGDPPPS